MATQDMAGKRPSASVFYLGAVTDTDAAAVDAAFESVAEVDARAGVVAMFSSSTAADVVIAQRLADGTWAGYNVSDNSGYTAS